MAMPQVAPAMKSAFRFPAEVRFGDVDETLELMQAALDAPDPRFDLSGCERFDSSLIALLLELSRRAAARQTRATFEAPPANLRKLAALYGVDELLFGS